MTNLWAAYVEAITRGHNQTKVQTETGISQSTISRWMKGEKTPKPPEAGKVARLAQVYERNVLEAFVASGVVTFAEARLGLPDLSVTFLADLGMPTTAVQESDEDLVPEPDFVDDPELPRDREDPGQSA